MTHTISPLDRLRLERAIQRIHRLGARSTGEFVLQYAARVGGVPALFSVIADYERLAVAAVRAAGGDRFPKRSLHEVRPWLPQLLRDAIGQAPYRSVLWPDHCGSTLDDCPPAVAATFIYGEAPLPAANMTVIIAEIEAALAEGGTVILLAMERDAREEVKAELGRRRSLKTPQEGSSR